MKKIIETLEYYRGYYCDLHNEVFNTDYYVVGTYDAKEALREYDVFEAIDKVQDFETYNFGEIHTEISDPEKLINMLFYVVGDEIICEMNEINVFSDNWDNVADEEMNQELIIEMKEKFSYELEA